jgi:hypothetical protein
VASLSLSGIASAGEGAAGADGDVRVAVLAADAGRLAIDATALDEYAGRYVTDEGQVFIVERDGDSLTIDLPDSFNRPALRLSAVAPRRFAAPAAGVRVTFEVDAAGRVTNAVVDVVDSGALAAPKAALRRGIVTIDDIEPMATASEPARI